MKTRLFASAGALAILAGTAHAQDLKFAPGEDARFNWDSFTAFDEATNLEGQSLSIFGPWRGEDQVLVESMLAYFTAASGVTVNYSSSENYEQQIVIDTQAGSPPDIAVLPQPGLIADLVSKGFVTCRWVPRRRPGCPRIMRRAKAGSALAPMPGRTAPRALRLPYKVDVKSLVWYVPENFEDAGYDRSRDDGRPQGADRQDRGRWRHALVHRAGFGRCDGLARDRLGRRHDAAHQSPETYDKWVSNELPFDSPEVIGAIEEFGAFARNDAFVAMAVPAAVASTDFRDSPKGLFTSPPQCYMHRRRRSSRRSSPKARSARPGCRFLLHAGLCVEGPWQAGSGGRHAHHFITKDSPAARAFIDFLKTPIAHEVWMAQSGFLTPQRA
jgi:alpha-glucoside transport system substrate-binding protein